MVHAAHQIHLSLLDVSGRDQSSRGETSTGEVADVEFGNKLSILSGDLLLAKACVGLAQLHTPKVGGVGWVGQTLAWCGVV